MRNLFLLAGFAVAGLCSTAPANVTFNNVRRLLFDTDGNQIDAYGSKVNYFGDQYYLYGNSFSIEGTAYGIKSYSSDDLITWKYEGFIYNNTQVTQCLETGGCGRPHIIYNPKSKKYILWANAGSSGYVVASSSSPTGPFTFSEYPAAIDPKFASLQPADFAVEVIDGTGYIVFSALNFEDPTAGSIWPPISQTLHVSELTADFMNTTLVSYPVTTNLSDLIDNETESPDIFKRGDYFYVAASNTCGYCNGSIGLLYKSDSYQGPWTRQILAGYSCNGQVEGVLQLVDPATGGTTEVWHSTSVPGSIRVGWGGHIFQPLVFDAAGDAVDLNCSPTASFTVPFTEGTAPAPAANTTREQTPALAVYSPVCDSDSFTLYQTWKASRSGTLESVSINVARSVQTVPLAITLFKFNNTQSLISPGYKWTEIGSGSFYANQTSYTFNTVTVPVTSNATVKEGDEIGFALSGVDYAPWCHLEFYTGNVTTSGYHLYQQGYGQNSWRGLKGETAPVYERVGKSIKFFATYA